VAPPPAPSGAGRSGTSARGLAAGLRELLVELIGQLDPREQRLCRVRPERIGAKDLVQWSTRKGACGLERLGTYGRVAPAGVRIARWWCPRQRVSISLLPSFLAARLRGTLASIEDAVSATERAVGVAAAVDLVRPPDVDDAVGLVGAERWLRRRVAAVRAALLAIVTLMPERFAGVAPSLAAFRGALSGGSVLVALRDIAERHLPALPAQLGFRTRAAR
jgi:hypothetical protein